MGGGLAFLSKKQFNPSNHANQKAVWEARQRKFAEERRLTERADELKREREDEELSKSIGAPVGNGKGLKFMYGPPPGLPRAETQMDTIEGGGSNRRYDAAAEKFMQQFTSTTKQSIGEKAGVSEAEQSLLEKGGEETEDRTSTLPRVDNRTALEREVGRKDTHRALTLDEQKERFPHLKNAPVVMGIGGTNVHVQFKPMGMESMRNVRCLKCGIWGHSTGDRECKVSGWDPFSSSVNTSFASRPASTPLNLVAHGTASTKNAFENNWSADDVVPKMNKRSLSHLPGDHVGEKRLAPTSGSSSDNSSRCDSSERSRRRRREKKHLKKRRKHSRHRYKYRSRRRDRRDVRGSSDLEQNDSDYSSDSYYHQPSSRRSRHRHQSHHRDKRENQRPKRNSKKERNSSNVPKADNDCGYGGHSDSKVSK